jgi:opacity protein-like surface antigen
MKTFIGMVVAAVIGAGTCAEAAESGFYAGVDIGPVDAAAGRSDGINVAFVPFPGIIIHINPSTTTVDRPNVSWGGVLGYRINRYFAAELAYTDFGSFTIEETFVVPPILPGGEEFVITHEVRSHTTGPSISMLGILPVAEGIEPFIRAGVLFTDHEAALVPGMLTVSSAEHLWILGGGIDFAIAPRWKARFAYEGVDRLAKTTLSGPVRLSRFAFGVSYDL